MMLTNLSGWHLLIILFFWLVPAAIVAIIAFIVVTLVRRRSQHSAPTLGAAPAVGSAGLGGTDPRVADGSPVAVRLRELDELRARKTITDAEYRERRDEVLRDL